ncbi:MAG: sel1 repeat family protein [Nitrospinae bacterium]|nr:sel1 repeat family protein [Nitrospinota bacterium]
MTICRKGLSMIAGNIVFGLSLAMVFSTAAHAAEGGGTKMELSPKQKEGVHEKVVQEIIQKAKEGDPDHQLVLGNMYYRGRGVVRDPLLAFEWFYRAAQQGKIEAMFAVGMMYYRGEGVERHTGKAMMWIKMAAEKEHIRAQYQMGFIYYTGAEGELEPDYEQAREWFTAGAKNGDPNAMMRMGNIWEYGRGVEKSKSAAADWYYRAGMTWLENFASRDDALACMDMIGRVDPQNELLMKLRKRIYSTAPEK